MKKRFISVALLAMTTSSFATAETLLDPRTRDEDISGATVAVAVRRIRKGAITTTIRSPIRRRVWLKY